MRGRGPGGEAAPRNGHTQRSHLHTPPRRRRAGSGPPSRGSPAGRRLPAAISSGGRLAARPRARSPPASPGAVTASRLSPSSPPVSSQRRRRARPQSRRSPRFPPSAGRPPAREFVLWRGFTHPRGRSSHGGTPGTAARPLMRADAFVVAPYVPSRLGKSFNLAWAKKDKCSAM